MVTIPILCNFFYYISMFYPIFTEGETTSVISCLLPWEWRSFKMKAIFNPIALRMAKTLLHSEWPKLYEVLAVLSAIRLKERICSSMEHILFLKGATNEILDSFFLVRITSLYVTVTVLGFSRILSILSQAQTDNMGTQECKCRCILGLRRWGYCLAKVHCKSY